MRSKSPGERPGCAGAGAVEGDGTPGSIGSSVEWERLSGMNLCRLIQIPEYSPASFSDTQAETPEPQRKKSFKDWISKHEVIHQCWAVESVT